MGGSRRRAGWVPDSGSFGHRLGDQRAEVIEALGARHGGSEKLLGVKGDHLLRAQSANTSLVGAPALPAWQRYTGVVWDHLDPTTLPAAALEGRSSWCRACSAWCAATTRYPTTDSRWAPTWRPLGKLSTWWRDAVTAEIARLARRHVIIDLLPQEHRAAWAPASSGAEVEAISVSLIDPTGKPGGHFAKAAKGELARAILLDGLDALDTWRNDRFHLEISQIG